MSNEKIAGVVMISIVAIFFLAFCRAESTEPTKSENLADRSDLLTAHLVTSVNSKSSENDKLSDNTAPESQKFIISVIDEYAEKYNEADNELKKSRIFKDRSKKISSRFENGRIKGALFEKWIGIITDMGTNGDGDAYVTIKINDKLSIKTWNNSFSDLGDRTLIKHGSKIYDSLENLKKGDRVIFSAEISKFGNLTEEGKMKSPEIIAKFTRIEPL
jgi:hypothetical protein